MSGDDDCRAVLAEYAAKNKRIKDVEDALEAYGNASEVFGACVSRGAAKITAEEFAAAHNRVLETYEKALAVMLAVKE